MTIMIDEAMKLSDEDQKRKYPRKPTAIQKHVHESHSPGWLGPGYIP